MEPYVTFPSIQFFEPGVDTLSYFLESIENGSSKNDRTHHELVT